jgi:hypothetical protein
VTKRKNGRNGGNERSKAKEKKIEQKLFRLMPALPRLLRRVHKRLENFDLKQPKTFLANLEGDFKAFEQTLQGRERRIWRLVWFLFGKFAVQIQAEQVAREAVAELKQAAAADERYSLLLKLMHDTDKRVPFASLLVHAWHCDPKTILGPNLVEQLREDGRIKDSTTSSEDRPFKVAAGKATDKEKKGLSNTLRDTDRMADFVSHADQIDLLQVDQAQEAIIRASKPPHRLAELGWAERCFSIYSLSDAVDKLRRLTGRY